MRTIVLVLIGLVAGVLSFVVSAWVLTFVFGFAASIINEGLLLYYESEIFMNILGILLLVAATLVAVFVFSLVVGIGNLFRR